MYAIYYQPELRDGLKKIAYHEAVLLLSKRDLPWSGYKFVMH